MKPGLAILLAILILYSSCNRSTSKEVQKETREQRKTALVFTALSTDPASVYTFELRQNNFFDYFGKTGSNKNFDLYAGTYQWEKDTIFLAYYNNHKPDGLNGKVWVDTIQKKLIMLSNDPARNRPMTIQ